MTDAEKQQKLREIFGPPPSELQNQSLSTGSNSANQTVPQPAFDQFGNRNADKGKSNWQDPGSEFGKAQLSNFADLGKGAWNAIVKPVASAVVGSVPSLYKAGEATVKSGLLATQWDKLTPGQRQEELQKINAGATAPIDIPGLGNVNYIAGDKNGQDVGQTARNIVGNAATIGSAALAFGNPLGNVKALAGELGDVPAEILASATKDAGKQAFINSVGAGTLGASGETLKNPNAGAGEVVGAGLIGGTVGALFHGVGSLISKAGGGKTLAEMTEKEIEKAGEKASLKPAEVEMMKIIKDNPEGQQKFADLIKQASEFAKNPDTTLSPVETVANDVTNGVKKLNALKEQAGSQIGATKEVIAQQGGKEIDFNKLQKLKNEFTKTLQSPGIRASWNPDGTIDFSKSIIKNSSGDQNLLQGAWDEIRNAQNSDQLIKAKDTIAQDLDFGKANQQISSSEKHVKDLLYGNKNHDGITGLINDAHPELGKSNDIFHELSDAVKAFQKKTSGTTSFTENTPISGTKTFNLIRQSLGSGTKENLAIIEGLENLGEKYNIPELQNIKQLRRMAQTAEDLHGIDVKVRPTSFAGRVFSGGKAVKDVATGNIPGVIANTAEVLQKGVQKPSQTVLSALGENDLSKLNLSKNASKLFKLLIPAGGKASGGLIPINDKVIGASSGILGSAIGASPFQQQNQVAPLDFTGANEPLDFTK